MAYLYPTSLAVALGLTVMLGGCSAGPIIDRLPEGIGLPAGAPARPVTSYQYPAVHDMPPARATQPMSEEEQGKLERDLAGLRERQAREASGDPDKKPAVNKKTEVKAAVPKKMTPDKMINLPPAGTDSKP